MVSARSLRFIALGASVGVLAASTARADDAAIAKGEYVGVTTAVRFDISPALRDLPPDLGEPLCKEQPDDRGGDAVVTGPGDIDPAVQASVGAPRIPAPLVSFDTLTGSARPPDPVGDVGPTQYVPMANSKFAIYNKTGTRLAGPFNINTLFSGFGGACEAENPGDPVVIYDQLADRWLLSQFTVAGPTYYNCVALSTTGDATGTYYRYAFTTGSYFGDYPKYGMWPDAYYISTRELNGASPGMGIYAANRAQMIAGNPAAQLITFRVPIGSTARYNIGDGFLPSDMDGTTLPPTGSPNYYVGTMDTSYNGAPQDALTLWKFHVDWTTPANSTFAMTNTIPTAAFDSNFPCSGRACIPQPVTAQKIDILGYRQRPTFRLAYRNFGTHESLVTNQSVEAAPAMAGARWYEVRSPNSSPVIYQQGTYAPGITDGIHRWMGSIAMDQSGNMALGFSASDGTVTFPSVWYTGRLATDPLGTMPQGEGHIVDGTNSQTSTSGRWGDYTAMTVDPTDDCTFWYINEYFVAGSQVWRLRVGSFKLSPCGSSSTSNVDIVTGPGPGPSNAPIVKGWNPDGTSNTITNFSAYSVSQYGANVALANYRTNATPFAADILRDRGQGPCLAHRSRGSPGTARRSAR